MYGWLLEISIFIAGYSLFALIIFILNRLDERKKGE